MCELDILHDSLYQFCPELHLKRLNSLTLACHALLDCKTLTLTELGRNLPTKARTKHNIKRIDRLLGNRHLHKERLAVYRWHASFICSGNTMPIVLVDWSDIREQKRLMVLRASVALHGRSVMKWSTKTGHRVRVFSSIDFPIRLVVTHHYIRAVLVRCNIQRY
ncbi:hypothetical protein MAX16_18410, partial [Escherichia coli]